MVPHVRLGFSRQSARFGLGLLDLLARPALGLAKYMIRFALGLCMDVGAQLLSAHERVLHRLFTTGLCPYLLLQRRCTLAQNQGLPHEVLETLRHDFQEDVDLLRVVAPEQLLEVSSLVANVERCQVDHCQAPEKAVWARGPKSAVPIRTIVLPSRIAISRSFVIPMESSGPTRSP